MGKQMTGILKTKAEKIYSMFPGNFTEDFSKNKEELNKTGLFEYSKSDRNAVAGFITRFIQRQKKKEE